jgi:putative spermidine/putrescine transport system substrate-binding protein
MRRMFRSRNGLKMMMGLTLSLLLLGGAACRKSGESAKATVQIDPHQLSTLGWAELERLARGTTVNYGMWAGDEARNRYFRGPFAADLRQRYGIELRIVPLGEVAEAVNKLLNEKGSGKLNDGSIDMIWINGENFGTAKQGRVLWGPFADALPNIGRYPVEARQRDFGTAIEGYEAPWQRAQFVMAWDTARAPVPPASIPELISWIKANPGRFTYPAPPDFTGSVFLRHLLYHFGGGSENFQKGFDEDLYRRAADGALALLRELRPWLWRRGETYPANPRELDRLFVNREIDLTMSYGPAFASERIARGEYPSTVRTFVFNTGTIGNYNYLAIPFNATNRSGALVVINHLMSVESLLDQSKVLGTIFPLDPARLTADERGFAAALPRGPATLSPEELDRHLLPEPDVHYLERLERDWRERVLQP